jgi:hypothetical protein
MVAAHPIGDNEEQAGLGKGKGAHLSALRSAAAIKGKDEVAIFVLPPFSTHIGDRGDPG